MNKRKLAVFALFTSIIIIEIVIGVYVAVNLTDTKISLLNPSEEPETLSFTLLYPSKSALFPIHPINSTAYVYLNITLNYVGVIAERQPVDLTVSGFMTKPMANQTDTVFVEFRGAVPYNNGSSTYGPWFSGVILQTDHVDQEGRSVFKNESISIVWNVQGYYNPVVVIRDKSTGDEYLQEYTNFPVYVIGFGDFQQAKSNKISTALSVAAFLLTVLFGIDLLLKLFELREKSDLNQVQTIPSVKSELNQNSSSAQESKEVDANMISELIRFVDDNKFELFKYYDVFRGAWGVMLGSLIGILVCVFILLIINGLILKVMSTLDQTTLALSQLSLLFAFFALTTKIGEKHIMDVRFKRALNLKQSFTEDEKPLLKALIKLRSRNPEVDLKRVLEMHPEMFKKEKLLENLYADKIYG